MLEIYFLLYNSVFDNNENKSLVNFFYDIKKKIKVNI